MSDDGRRTDNSDGGESARVTTQPGADNHGLAKILPFPRDWFGPIDDLIPVFPEPEDGKDAEPADGPPAGAPHRSAPSAANGSAASRVSISAASFWDEDAGAVHQVVESLDRRWVGDGEAEALVPVDFDGLDSALRSDSMQDSRSVSDSVQGPGSVHGLGPGLESSQLGGPQSDKDPSFDPEDSTNRAARVRLRRPVALMAVGLSLTVLCAAVALLVLTGGLRHKLTLSFFTTKPAPVATVHQRPAAASRPVQTVATVTVARTAIRRHRHRTHRPVHHAVVASRAHSGASLRSGAVSVTTAAVRPSVSTPAGGGASSSATGSASGSSAGSASSGPASGGCVQSPDSGCLP